MAFAFSVASLSTFKPCVKSTIAEAPLLFVFVGLLLCCGVVGATVAWGLAVFPTLSNPPKSSA
ncbi:hypothetical protein D3C71_2172220 [compost metagenome]